MRFGQADRSKKGYGGLTVSPAYSDGHLYLGISISIGDDKRRALVFRVDALSGAFEHIGHGGIPHVAEKGLIARLLWKPESAPQVQIRSRE